MSLIHGPVEEVGEAERAHEHHQDEQEGEEAEEAAVGQRSGVGRHGVLEEEVSDRAFAKCDNPALHFPPTAHTFFISHFTRDWRLCVDQVLSTSSSGAGGSEAGVLTPMTPASQRVSGKVSNIKTTKMVRGAARNAPGPPSSHAQKINPIKRTVGERLSPRPISIGESAFSANMLITMTPAITSRARSRPCSARARTTAGATARGNPIQGMKLKKKAKMPHIRGKSTPRTRSKMVTPAPVTRLTMARSPSWRTTFRPKTVRRCTCGRSLPALACSLFIMAGPSARKNSTIIRMRNRLLRKSATPDRRLPMAPVMALGLTAFFTSTFESPKLLARS